MLLTLGLLNFTVALAIGLSALLYKQKCTLYRMHNDLIDWIECNIADDIYKSRDHRPEFKYYVDRVERDLARRQSIVKNVVLEIRLDLESKSVLKPIYFRLLWLDFKNLFIK